MNLASVALVPVSASIPVLMLGLQVVRGNSWRFNDFAAYWLAARLLDRGANPYAAAALAALAVDSGVQAVGVGYSYPLPFALLMVPLARLPFDTAAWLFTLASCVAFGVTAAVLVETAPALRGQRWEVRAGAAVALGAYPPVTSSLVIGQVNLLVLALVCLGLVCLGWRLPPTPGRGVVAGVMFGLAAVGKLIPAILLLPLLLGRSWAAVLGLLATVVGTLAAAALIAPAAGGGTASLVMLFDPDPYWTNQSINGVVSRMVMDSDRTLALAPELFPPAPVSALGAGFLLLATAILSWQQRTVLGQPRILHLALGTAFVAATIAAPKTSFNTHAFALLGAAAVVWTAAPLGRLDRWLLGIWLGGAAIEAALEPLAGPLPGPLAGLRTVLSSSATFGLCALWLVLARQLQRAARDGV